MTTRFKAKFRNHAGFTFIELILVIVLIGILSSVAAQRMISVAATAEISAEESIIQVLRENLIHNYGDDLTKGKAAVFSEDPFKNLQRVPEGYDRRRSAKPTGEETDDGLWVFIKGIGSGNITAEQAGTTLASFQTTGLIYHQRRDHTIVKWPYDGTTGTVGSKIIELKSELKEKYDLQQSQQGEQTEEEQLQKKQKLDFDRTKEIDAARQRKSNLDQQKSLEPQRP